MREYSNTASAQIPSGPPNRAESKDPPGRWKQFWLYFAGLAILAAAGCILFSLQEINTYLKIVKSAESTKVRLAVGSVSLDIRNLVSDMAVLNSHLELKRFLENKNDYSRQDLEEEFRRLCEAKKIYDQVRLLDLKGQELIRVNNTPNGPQPVSRRDLQNKGHRYYFRESVKLSRGQCYISPFDLNMENKKVEIPFKPMIRVGAPVFNVSGEKEGVLILNYLGQEILNHFANLNRGDGGQLMLLNQKGYWLYSAELQDQWGFMFEDKAALTFAKRYPDSWAKMLANQKGEYLGPEGFISYQLFKPQHAELKGSDETRSSDVWIVASLLPKEKLDQAYIDIITPVISTFGVLLTAFSLALWFMLRARQNRRLSEAEIKRSEAKYRRLVENLPQGYFFYTHDTDGVFNYVSPSVSENLGYSQAEFMRYYEDFLTDNPINREVVRYTKGSINGEQQAPYELEIYHKDGSKRWLEVVEFPVFDQDGMVLGVDGIAHDLSQHRQTMEALRQTRDFLNSLLEIAPMPISVRNLDGSFRLVNAAWEKMTGLSRSEVKGRHFSELLPEDLIEWVEKYDQKVVHTKKPQAFDQTVFHRQVKRHYLSTVFPLFDPDGLVEAVGSVSIDLTENLLNQERLKDSEKRFRELADLLPTIVAELDENLIITYFNREGMSKFAIRPEDIKKGLSATELVHPDDHHKLERHTKATREAIQMGPQEYRLLSKDGSQFVGVVLSQPILRKGSFQGYRVTVMDITPRIRMEESLRASEQRYRRLYDAMRDGLAAVDMDGRITDFNQSFQDMLGYDEDEIYGLTYQDITPAKWHDKETRILEEQVLTRGYSEVYEKEYRRKDGKIIPVNLRTYSLVDSEDKVTGLWAILRDISLQKQVQSELIRAKEAAEVANRAKSRFLATMSHEIRTPMNAIIGMTNLALDTGLSQEQKEYLNIVQSSADQLLLLIDEILDLSRIESGRVERLYESFDLVERVNLIIKTLSPRAWEKGITLTQNIDSEVPRQLVGDADRLRQVIYNLISNAIKFTAKGSVSLSINAIESGADQAILHFAVKDTGIGIAADKLQEIFEPFSQADASTTRKYGGSGLGLAISRELVNMMGGELSVKSRPGKGSTFYFELAFDRAEEELKGTAAAKVPLPEAEPAVVKGLSVLLAEDNLVNQKLAVALLEKRGHRVDVSLDGRQTVEMFKNGAYDLIFMDVEMPEMDGVEATKQIRRIESGSGKRIPIIAMTAHAMMGDKERLLEAGMDAYLAKPIDFERLDRIIHKFYS